MGIKINLKQVNSAYNQRLFDFFDSQSQLQIKLWKKDTTYQFKDGTQFEFTNDVFQRDSKKANEVRYELISKKEPIGSGATGTVYRVKGSVNLGKNFRKVGKDGLRRVVKTQIHEENKNPLSLLLVEYQASTQVPHLAVKEPAIMSSGTLLTSYLVMNHLPGEDLFDLLSNHQFSTQERIKLTRALLQALKTQVIDKKLIHRDIKPENIIVDIKNFIVNIIDYGFAFNLNNSDGYARGTPYYFAPETITQYPPTYHKYTDVYSLGRVIALLWAVNLSTYSTGYPIHRIDSPETKITDLFIGINDLNVEDEKIIRNCLLGMLQNEPENRISIDEAIKAFSHTFNIEKKSTPNLVENKNSFFSLPKTDSSTPKFSAKKSCFSNDQYQQIIDTIIQLQQEIDSWWPYPNKDRKQEKVDGLNALLKYSEIVDNIADAIIHVETNYPSIRSGKLSRRTHHLLDNLLNNSTVQNLS